MAILVISAVSVIMPLALNDGGNDNSPASVAAWNPAGKREAVYKFDHWGETFLKPSMWNRWQFDAAGLINTVSIQDLGHHGNFLPGDPAKATDNPTGMGVSDWLNNTAGTPLRQTKYDELGVRTDHYPFIFANNPNSPETPGANGSLACDYIIWIPYRITGTIKNESMARTGSGGPATAAAGGQAWRAFYVPHLGRGNWDTKTGLSGGYINCTYYGTYLTDAEQQAITTPHPNPKPGNVHYAQWFYGASASFLNYANDGYQYELQGRIRYSVDAAMAYLGYPGLGTNIFTWWNASAGAISTAWKNDWTLNGSYERTLNINQNSTYRGISSIFTNYEYDMNNSGLFSFILKLDLHNTSYTNGRAGTYLTIRLYSVSYGIDSLMMRMMERSNVTGWWANNSAGRNIRGSMIDYHEDMYWNITAGPSKADMFFRQVTTYRATAWEDPSSSVFMGGWMVEAFHTDYLGNGIAYGLASGNYWSYPSPFERYDADTLIALSMPLDKYSTIEQVPGTRRYQKNASYFTTPVLRNISKFECFIFDLNTSHYWGSAGRDFIGINPAWTADPTWGSRSNSANAFLLDNYANSNFTKNMYWGKLKLGDYCMPFSIVKNWKTGAYNNDTQVLNISGGSTALGTVGLYMTAFTRSGRDYWQGYSTTFLPAVKGSINYEKNLLGMGNRINEHGMPFIQLDVVPVDRYKVEIFGSHMTTAADKIKITVLNGTGAKVTNWNGSVQLTSTDTAGVWGTNGSSHTFVPGDNGVWWTTINWSASGTGVQTITALDRTNSTTSFQDIFGRASVSVILFVPEFTDVLIPVVGMMAIFFVIGKAKKRKDENT